MDNDALILTFNDLEELSRAAASEVAAIAAERGASASHTPAGTLTIALAGGNTPRRLYEILAADYRESIDWSRLLIFWGDERYVPEDSPQSNYRMAREALLDHVPIPSGNIMPMRTTFDAPERAADAYEELLRSHFPGGIPRFDLVLLGIGDDGHTASLFPGSPALHEESRWVAVTQAPAEPRTRLTLTPPVLAHARRLLFLVSGESKQPVMEEVVNQPEKAEEKYPAAMIAGQGNATWFVDRNAFPQSD